MAIESPLPIGATTLVDSQEAQQQQQQQLQHHQRC